MIRRMFVASGLFSVAAVGSWLWLATSPAQTPPIQPIPNPAPALIAEPIAATATPITTPMVNPIQPATAIGNPSRPNITSAPIQRYQDLASLPQLTRQMVQMTQRSSEWLFRFNQPNGRFLPGYLPAVNRPLEGDRFLTQATAAFALARAARFTGDERYQVRASMAVMNLLTETRIDPSKPGLRFPAMPSMLSNRIAGAGMLISAIAELSDPSPDMLARSEELTTFILAMQQADGSLHYTDTAEPSIQVDPTGANRFPAMALFGVMRSHSRQPAEAKLAAVKKALSYYRDRFQAEPSFDAIPWLSATCSEWVISSKDTTFVPFSIELNDRLCRTQYTELDSRNPLWFGGFRSIVQGESQSTPPDAQAALAAMSLAEACRLCRHTADLQRYERYRAALVRSLQFLSTLQFNDDNAQHFAPSMRSLVIGGIHPTHLDGTLYVQDSAHGVIACVQFFAAGADRP